MQHQVTRLQDRVKELELECDNQKRGDEARQRLSISTEEEKTRLQKSLHQLQGQHKNLQLELKKRDLVIDYMETSLGEAMANFMQLQVSLWHALWMNIPTSLFLHALGGV